MIEEIFCLIGSHIFLLNLVLEIFHAAHDWSY